MKRKPLLCAAVLMLALLPCVRAQEDPVMKAMRDELARSVSQLRLPDLDKPYFVAYRVKDVNQVSVSATLGSVSNERPNRGRVLKVEVRVGDYALDNSNFLSTRTMGLRGMGGLRQAPVDDNYQEVRRLLWLATDSAYKNALEELSAKRAVLQNRRRSEELPDFSKATPVNVQEPPAATRHDMAALEALARELSAVFRNMPEVLASSVDIDARIEYVRYVNSEGTSYTQPQTLVKLEIKAQVQASDGQPVEDTLNYYGRTAADLPPKEKLLAECSNMGARLKKLRAAGFVEAYNGPVLFEDEAAAEIFAQVFAPKLVAARAPLSDNPQFDMVFAQMAQFGGGSFQDKIGGRVLPEFLGVVDDPCLQEYKAARLPSSYKVDEDGVPATETRLVERGVLKALLAGRMPTSVTARSTGSQRGLGVIPGTLTLMADKSLSRDALRQELLRQAQARGRSYGLIVRRAGAGGLNTFLQMAVSMASGRGATGNSLIEVVKLFADGHEEVVRGAEVSGMTPASFKDIVAAGDSPILHNEEFMPAMTSLLTIGFGGMIGDTTALPVVSYIVPSLLFEELSVKKGEGQFPSPPVVPSPLAEGQGH